jgi:RimJ/RimL family protein N-acetyltransferase
MQARLDHALCSLVPLSQDHATGLAHVANSAVVQSVLLCHNPHLHIPTASDVPAYIARALKMQATGRELPYAVLNPQGAVLGTTRFQAVALNNRRADIGSTWLTPQVHGQAVNAACKWLLLRRAFEVMGLQRVGFTVHPDNARSRAALEGMGAGFEGMLHHWQTLHGVQADMCIYSVLANDWLDVRARLEWRMVKQVAKQEYAPN